jgi:hypothetical protein
MPSWTCDIVGARPDSDLTWRRTDASEPRGTIPLELLPAGAAVGSRVVINVERDPSGQWTVLRCELASTEAPASKSRIERIPSAVEPSSHEYLKFGQIRWCNVRNPIENLAAVGKWRPAMLASENGTRWRIMGFTTKSRFEDGAPRVAIPDFRAIGLPRTGYLWGHRLTRIDTSDIGIYIGQADSRLTRLILNVSRADLTMSEIAEFRRALDRAD